MKEYHGQTVVVRVLDTGFEYDGRRFASLSAIAKEITGTKWNGFLFFGLLKGSRLAAEGRLIRTVPPATPAQVRCAIYTRKSTDEGLDQAFNSLDAQRESAEAFIRSQRQDGWIALPERYDDGGFTGANTDRPALERLLEDIAVGKVGCVVVYKVDRLSRSILDFLKMMELLEKHGRLRVGDTTVRYQDVGRAAVGEPVAHVCAI